MNNPKNGTQLKRIVSGVSFDIDNGQFKFDWTANDPDKDILLLNEDTSGVFDEDDVGYFYAYTYNPNAELNQIATFRRALKSEISYSANNSLVIEDEVNDFVEDGVLRLDKFKRLRDFAVIVNVRPTKVNQLLDTMRGYIAQYVKSKHLRLELIKRMHDEVQFDAAQARRVLSNSGNYDPEDIESHIRRVTQRFELAKRKRKLFEMKHFAPEEIRHGFSNFLKFASAEHQRLYESLQGVDVLIYDDFYTSGATVKEIIRLLRSIHEDNTLTVFVLIKQ